MSFISRLEAVGKGILGVWSFAAPMAGALGFPAGVLGEIDRAVQIAEATALAVGQAKAGAAKSQAIIGFVKEALLASSLVAGHEIGDEALFTQAAQGMIDSVVLLEKAIRAKT